MAEKRLPGIILTSGGLDSTTCLALAAQSYAPLYTLSFDYGQRHRHELDAAARVSAVFHVAEHRVIRIDLRQFGQCGLAKLPEVDPDHAMLGDMEDSRHRRAQGS